MAVNPVTQFARAALKPGGKFCRLVQLACQRHLRDLDEGPARGLHFDAKAAQHAIDFFGLLNLPEKDGEAGHPFKLEPWQRFIVGSLFGWRGADGYRRFRTGYIELAKGQGKTPTGAGCMLYCLTADNEASAEVYSAATTREQAGIAFRDAKGMASGSPQLRKMLEIGEHNLAFLKGNAFARPVSSEHRGLDGKRPHMALIDEIHEHPNPMVVDKIKAGTKGRRQALILEITNSGFDRNTICWRHHEYSEKILKGLIQADDWFAFLCGLDPCQKHWDEGYTQPVESCPDCDDWMNENCWHRANINLGVSVTMKYLRSQVAEAKAMPAQANIVKRLNFCIWTQTAERVIPMDAWDRCARKPDYQSLRSLTCRAGIDIGATSDFTALTLLFAHDDASEVEIPLTPSEPDGPKIKIMRRSYTLLPYFWLPENPVRRDSRMMETLALWRREGFIRTTPGSEVHYETVFKDILEIVEPYNVLTFSFDAAFQGVTLHQLLSNRFGNENVPAVRQGAFTLAAPWREFLELVKQERLHHDGNPVLTWMASNTAQEESGGGLTKPSKQKSTEKIDGVVAAVMGLSEWMKSGLKEDNENWYVPGCLSD